VSRTERVAERSGSWSADGRSRAPLLVPDLPPEVPFGILGRILPTRRSAELQLELHPLERDAALRILEHAAASAESEVLATPSGEDLERRSLAGRAATTAREIGRQLALREQELWRVGVTFLGTGPTWAHSERIRDEVAQELATLGFRSRIPAFAAEPAGAVPGGDGLERRPSGYWHLLHTDGLAAFFPFVDEAVCEPGGVLVGLLLDDAGPVLIDRWAHASHSWGIFGTTGAGKSFAASLLALRSHWLDPSLEVLVIDPLGEFAGLARALGGDVLELGPGGSGRLNPLDPVTTGGDGAEKAGRVGSLLRALFPSLLDEEVAVLDRALHRLYAEGPQVPTFSDLLRAVEREPAAAGRLPTLLQVFTTGSLAYLDGPTTLALDRTPLVLSLAGVPEDHRAFHLSYVLDTVYGRLRASPGRRLVLIDEAHVLVHHPGSAEFLDRVVRQVRHFGAGFLLLSQHPEDFLRSPAGRSILANLSATLLLRLTSVSSEAAELFQLTKSETEWLPRARLPREVGYSEALLRMGAAHLPIAVVASTPEYEFLSQVLATAPSAPEAPGVDTSRNAPLSREGDRTPPAHDRR
jgi:Helicase HerA, central domain